MLARSLPSPNVLSPNFISSNVFSPNVLSRNFISSSVSIPSRLSLLSMHSTMDSATPVSIILLQNARIPLYIHGPKLHSSGHEIRVLEQLNKILQLDPLVLDPERHDRFVQLVVQIAGLVRADGGQMPRDALLAQPGAHQVVHI